MKGIRPPVRHLALLGIIMCLLLPATSLARGGSSSATTKSAMLGLVDMGDITFNAHPGAVPVNTLAPLDPFPGIFGGIVINVTWAQLQPVQTSTLTSGNAIDVALSQVRTYNARHAQTPLTAKLRIWPGVHAPAWAIALSGGAVTIYHKATVPESIGRFWTTSYKVAWQRFLQQVAARYDGDPLVHEVSVTSCATVTDEPFIVPADRRSVANLHAAGYSDTEDRACLSHAVQDYRAWHRTRLDLVVNPFAATDSGHRVVQLSFTQSVMRSCRKSAGVRCVLDNHSLLASPTPSYIALYAAMTGLGPEIEFQTASPVKPDTAGAVRLAVTLHATAVELWPSAGQHPGFIAESPATLRDWASMLKRNTTP